MDRGTDEQELCPGAARVRAAQGDAGQAQGRLRAGLGGGAAELPGIRLMASGLPWPQWNSGDVTDPGAVDIGAVRAWYAARAHGAGVPWGVRVPAGLPWGHGRRVFRQRCMGLAAAAFVPAAPVPGLHIRAAVAADAALVAQIDADAFDAAVDVVRPWIEPTLGAEGFTVALAEREGQAVGIATGIVTGLAAASPGGPAVGVFGVGVRAQARCRGIGAALTTWLLQRAFAQGATLAHLNPDSEAAARLYARLGFVETDGFDIHVDD